MGDLTPWVLRIFWQFSVFDETKFLIFFLYFWKLSTMDRWYTHNFFAIRNIKKKNPCQITDIIIVLISTNFEKIIFKIVDARPCAKNTY